MNIKFKRNEHTGKSFIEIEAAAWPKNGTYEDQSMVIFINEAKKRGVMISPGLGDENGRMRLELAPIPQPTSNCHTCGEECPVELVYCEECTAKISTDMRSK